MALATDGGGGRLLVISAQLPALIGRHRPPAATANTTTARRTKTPDPDAGTGVPMS
jgi:hypothetical protein